MGEPFPYSPPVDAYEMPPAVVSTEETTSKSSTVGGFPPSQQLSVPPRGARGQLPPQNSLRTVAPLAGGSFDVSSFSGELCSGLGVASDAAIVRHGERVFFPSAELGEA